MAKFTELRSRVGSARICLEPAAIGRLVTAAPGSLGSAHAGRVAGRGDVLIRPVAIAPAHGSSHRVGLRAAIVLYVEVVASVLIFIVVHRMPPTLQSWLNPI